jgi:hypothetical protein
VSRFVGWALVLVGVIGQAVGRVLNNATRPGLDAVGRVLNATGLSVILVGALLLMVGDWLYGRAEPPSAIRAVQVAAPVVIATTFAVFALAVVGAGSPATASNGVSSAIPAHEHDTSGVTGAVTPSTGTPSTVTPSTNTPATVLAGANAQQTDVAAQITAGSTHEHGVARAEQPMDAASRAKLGEQLTQARQAAMGWPTVADAEAAGYRMVTPYLPLIGAHYIRWDLMDGTFDLSNPEMLLYDGTLPSSKIVGLSYYLFSDKEPDVFAGPNDHWHQHIGLCLKDNVVIGAESMSAATCASLGGTKAEAANGWMIHAWVVPGWESPEGVFSPEHAGLT